MIWFQALDIYSIRYLPICNITEQSVHVSMVVYITLYGFHILIIYCFLVVCDPQLYIRYLIMNHFLTQCHNQYVPVYIYILASNLICAQFLFSFIEKKLIVQVIYDYSCYEYNEQKKLLGIVFPSVYHSHLCNYSY